MTIFDRYILRQHLPSFLFGIATFTAIFVGTDVLYSLANLMVDYNAPLHLVVRIFFLSLPEILVLTLPMGVLISVVMTFGRLSREGEITAFRAGGVSIKRLAYPVLVAALVLGGVNILFNETVTPLAQERVRELRYYARYDREMPLSQENIYMAPVDRSTGKVDFMFYAHFFDGKEQLKDVIFQDYEDGRLVAVIEAEEALWREQQWVFINGRSYQFVAGERVLQGTFSQYRIPELQRTPSQIALGRKPTREMSMSELREVILSRREENREALEYEVFYHQRWAVPLASFIIVLLAAPLGIQPTRSGTSIGMGVSVCLIFAYYMLMTVGSALAEAGHISPVLGGWLQNFVFGFIGFVMLVFTDR